MKWHRTKHAGIQVRHKLVNTREGKAPCPAEDGGRCRCEPSYRYAYRPLVDGKAGPTRYSKVYRDLDECRSAQVDQRRGRSEHARNATGETFRALWLRWLEGAKSGQISARGKERAAYSPRTLAIYERDMNRHILPTMGDRQASKLGLADWQALLDSLRREHKLSHNSLQTIYNSVRAVYRWACAPARGLLAVNAVHGLEMPAKDEVKRDRIAPPDEARRLLAALDKDPRCFPYDVLDFAIALYAGMRNIERWGLEWTDVAGIVTTPDACTPERVMRSEFRALSIRRETTKSAAGVRTLPVIALLRPILMREWMRQGQPTSGPVLRPPNGGKPENAYGKQAKRVAKAWADAGLERITPHEARHTYASYLIASGLNAKAVTVLMGHSSIEITFDRYGHLFPGHEDEAGKLLDAHLGTPDDDAEEATG